MLFDGFLVVILISERSSSWKMSGEGSRLGLEFPQEGGCNASKRCGEILIAFYLLCPTSIVILILACLHEGPRTKNGCHGKTSDGWRLWVFVLMETVMMDTVNMMKLKVAYEVFVKMFQRSSSFEDIYTINTGFLFFMQ